MSVGSVSLPRLVPTPPGSVLEARLSSLVERIQADDPSAFDELYRLTRNDVARTLYHLVGRRRDLEDLVQEVYVGLLKSLKGFRGDSRFRTFLYRVCANVALMHLRWWRRRPEEPVDVPPEQVAPGNPEQEAERAQAAALVHRALEALSAKKRVVFVYHELCGMGPEEISEATGCTYNTVRSRLHHARLEFTQELERLLRQGKEGAHAGA